MVLLIDANIILDVLMNRQEFVKDFSMIWKLCETEKAKGYVVYYDENVPLFRRNVYRKSGAMILRVRSRDTALN